MKSYWLAVPALAVSLAFATPALMADHGQGKGNGKGKGNPHAAKMDDDAHGWERRDGYEYRMYGDHDGRPPGWSHGKKTGWKNCGLPPGQAKKYGCRTYVYEGRPHYYYQDERGAIIIRRPTVSVHGGVDIH
jgi:hypothetical protein